MSDLMLFGVLRMPHELAMADELSRRQYWERGQQAADEIEQLQAENKRQQIMLNHLGDQQDYIDKLEKVLEAANEVIEGCDRNTLSAGQVYVDEGSLRALIVAIAAAEED